MTDLFWWFAFGFNVVGGAWHFEQWLSNGGSLWWVLASIVAGTVSLICATAKSKGADS